MSEQQRVAIITGAAGGIGRELVLGLLGKGLKVAAVDRTTQGLAELTRAVQQRQQGANLMTIEADLARDESIDEIVSTARGRFGVVDILVNNAGVGQATVRSDNRQHPIKFWEVSPEQWKLFVAVHTSAPMALSRALVDDMMRQKWGRIVNVTTSLGTMIREGSPTYGPSKAALEAFSAIMAKDLAGTGVTVNVLGAGRGHQYRHGTPRGRLRPRRDDPACSDDAAAQLVGVGRGRRRDRAALSRGALGSEPAAGRGCSKSRRPGGLDRDRNNADRAAAARLTIRQTAQPHSLGSTGKRGCCGPRRIDSST
jgi:NAD(P)-dependent dehydrogenase (short-subunit alcohol dehydrogenase family)